MRIQIARAVSNNVYTKRKENRSLYYVSYLFVECLVEDIFQRCDCLKR